jgi:two-component system, OmpR family, response regulator RegX3
MQHNAPTTRSFSTSLHAPETAPDRVVIACAPPRALALAAAFGANSIVPILAFDSDQFFRCTRAGAELAIVEPHVTGSTPLVVAAAESHVGLLVIADAERLDHDVRAIAVGVVKPASQHVDVVAHAQVLLRRQRFRAHAGVLTWGPLRVDVDRRHVLFADRRIAVTPLQLRILAALVRAQGHVLSRAELQQAIWPDEPTDDGRRLDAHIRRIRARLGDDPLTPQVLLTVRAEGFRLADVDDLEAAFEPRGRIADAVELHAHDGRDRLISVE